MKRNIFVAVISILLMAGVAYGAAFVGVTPPPTAPTTTNGYPYNLPFVMSDGTNPIDSTNPLYVQGTVTATTTTEVYDTFETQVILLTSGSNTTITPSMPVATQRGYIIKNQGAGSLTYNINAAATATTALMTPGSIESLFPCKVTTMAARGYGAAATVEVRFVGKL